MSAYALIVEAGHPAGPPDRAAASCRCPTTTSSPTATSRPTPRFGAPGFDWYEVSNWATGPEAPAAGTTSSTGPTPTGGAIGPGAHSHVGGLRWWNVKHPAAYADRLARGESPAQDAELLDDADRALETVMLGLRLREGLPLTLLSATGRRAGRGRRRPRAARPGGPRGGRAVLTDRGRLLADAVVRDLTD